MPAAGSLRRGVHAAAYGLSQDEPFSPWLVSPVRGAGFFPSLVGLPPVALLRAHSPASRFVPLPPVALRRRSRRLASRQVRRVHPSRPRRPPPPEHSRQHRGNVSGPEGRTRRGPSPHSRCPDPAESEATPSIPPLLGLSYESSLLCLPHANPLRPQKATPPLVDRSPFRPPGEPSRVRRPFPIRGGRPVCFP